MTNQNMGSVSQEEIEEFFQHVEKVCSLSEDYFRWTPASPSRFMGDHILIRQELIGRYPWEAYQEVLHETAHIQAIGHGPDFHRVYGVLIQQILGDTTL